LINVQVVAKVSKLDGPLNKLHKDTAPRGFHLQYFVPDAPLYVIELKQTSSHGTSPWESGALGPSEPAANERAQARQTFFGGQGWPQDALHREFGHMRQQLNLNFFFRAKVRKQPALGHSHLISKNAERNPI
jgi:hypothetical protein